MAEYIDREALCKILENWRDAHADVDDEEGCGLLEDVIWEVNAQPAADVAPVVHGRDVYKWHKEGHCEFKCSVCGAWAGIIEGGTLDGVDFDYFPNCGAKMDGGADDADQR